MANTQTKATKKYQERIGLISKSYKLKKELTEQFAEKCRERGEGQATVISRLMKEYIDQENISSI